MLGDLDANVGREVILKPKIGKESLHVINNQNGVKSSNYATSRNLSKVWCSHIVTFINSFGQHLMDRHTVR
jgi:hypothetical protein